MAKKKTTAKKKATKKASTKKTSSKTSSSKTSSSKTPSSKTSSSKTSSSKTSSKTKTAETASKKASKKAGKKASSAVKLTLAQKAEVHALYEESVQDPETEVAFLESTFKSLRGREAKTLREDFCGTAVLSLEWAKSEASRKAWGVDLCEKTQAWGQTNRIDKAPASVAKRVELLNGNVLTGLGPKVDIATAFNFSFWIFKKREDMLAYFRTVHKKLKSDGIFVIDMLGGTELYGIDETETEFDDFSYFWEQASYNPLNNDFLCHIHFTFPDGSRLDKAFTYDWRLWTPAEIADIMSEAGFSKVRRYWEKTDRRGEGTGEFYEPSSVDNEELWWTYMVAER